MSTGRSKDGTTIAYDRHGEGTPVILVGAAFPHRAFDPSAVRVAELLAAGRLSDLHSVRRGRGESGDTEPYGVEHEIEDVDAMIDAAGGAAALYGSSSGGCLAGRGLSARPGGFETGRVGAELVVDDSRPPLPDDYVSRLDELVAAGFAVPVTRMRSLAAPTLVLDGGQTPWMARGAGRSPTRSIGRSKASSTASSPMRSRRSALTPLAR